MQTATASTEATVWDHRSLEQAVAASRDQDTGVTLYGAGYRVTFGAEQAQVDALRDVMLERDRQDQKWGEQNHDAIKWTAIELEELGEAAMLANKTYWSGTSHPLYGERLLELRAELVQVAAVAVAWIESLERNQIAAARAEGLIAGLVAT